MKSNQRVDNRFRLILIILAELFLAFLVGCSNDTKNQPPPVAIEIEENWEVKSGLNVLFIGNSLTYANDLPGILQRMLVASNIEVGRIDSIALPNHGLPDHWEKGDAQARIALGGWDVVVLQQGPSATEGRPYLLEYTPLFAAEIESVGAQAALYMVWPSKARFYDFERVSDSYRIAAMIVDGLLYPAGEAWLAAWDRNPSIKLYSEDDFHPSLVGTYLAALVIFEQLTDIDLNDLPPVIPALGGNVAITSELSVILQDAAKEANANFAFHYP